MKQEEFNTLASAGYRELTDYYLNASPEEQEMFAERLSNGWMYNPDQNIAIEGVFLRLSWRNEPLCTQLSEKFIVQILLTGNLEHIPNLINLIAKGIVLPSSLTLPRIIYEAVMLFHEDCLNRLKENGVTDFNLMESDGKFILHSVIRKYLVEFHVLKKLASIDIPRSLFSCFNENFIITHTDEQGENFLHVVMKLFSKLDEARKNYCLSLLDDIEDEYGIDVLKRLLLQPNNNDQTPLDILFSQEFTIPKNVSDETRALLTPPRQYNPQRNHRPLTHLQILLREVNGK